MKTLFAAILLFTTATATAETYDVNTVPPERPQVPSSVTPAPPALCMGESGPVPVSQGFTPTCNPVNDWWCWEWCSEQRVSLADVYHPNGQAWREHWISCTNTVIAERVRREQAESKLAELQAYRVVSAKKKNKK